MDYIFYHGSDLDGACSGAIINRICHEAWTMAWEYNYAFPETFKPTFNDTVYFVDCSTNPYDRILELTKITNVIMIDHHKSFIEWAEQNVSADIRSKWVLDTKKSGCMLCWEYAFPNKPMPRTVDLLGNYDIWNNKDLEYWNKTILPFQYGMRGTKMEDVLWNELLVPEWEGHWIGDIISRGEILIEYITSSNTSMVRKHSFESTFDGYKVLACNTHNFSSQTFESIWDDEKYDFMVAFTHSKGKEYWVSLYTTKTSIDLSKIASKYGGGGHAQAAGFTVKSLVVDEKEIKVTA